jgi:hypothetical protein
VDSQKKIVSVGAGSTWGDIFRFIDRLGIAVVGGASSSESRTKMSTGRCFRRTRLKKGVAPRTT